MSSKERHIIEMQMDLAEIQRKCIEQQRRVTEHISWLHDAATRFDQDTVALLPTNSLPITFERQQPLSLPEMKLNAFQWLFKKAVEDLVFGWKESVIDAYKYLKMGKVFQGGKQYSVHELTQLAQKINEDLESFAKVGEGKAFSELIKAVENYSGTPIFLAEEILSINALRNCLVHRNGWANQKDCKTKDTQALILFYQELVFSHEIDGVRREMRREDKINRKIEKNVAWQVTSRTKPFPVGTCIIIDQHIFNGLLYTGSQFASRLLTQTLQSFQPQNNSEPPV